MSELQEVTTTELEDKINPNNDSIILSEKENDSDIDSDLDDDDFDFPGDENIPIIPERPPIGSENTVIENNDPDNNMVYERDEIESDNESEKSDESKKDTENENNAPENVVISTETAANSFIASEDEDIPTYKIETPIATGNITLKIPLSSLHNRSSFIATINI